MSWSYSYAVCKGLQVHIKNKCPAYSRKKKKKRREKEKESAALTALWACQQPRWLGNTLVWLIPAPALRNCICKQYSLAANKFRRKALRDNFLQQSQTDCLIHYEENVLLTQCQTALRWRVLPFVYCFNLFILLHGAFVLSSRRLVNPC